MSKRVGREREWRNAAVGFVDDVDLVAAVALLDGNYCLAGIRVRNAGRGGGGGVGGAVAALQPNQPTRDFFNILLQRFSSHGKSVKFNFASPYFHFGFPALAQVFAALMALLGSRNI